MRLSRKLSFFIPLVWLWGCGGGSSVTPPSLSSIVVTPSSVTLWAGLGTQQFTATGHYTDGSSKDLTSSVTWSSSSPSVASVAGGIATPLAGGTTNIQGKSGGVSGASLVTVVGLAKAYVTPSGPALSLTGSPSGTQLSVTGAWTDGKTQDVTSLVSWSSSDINIANVNGSGYVSRATNAGYATISANWGSATLSTAVSVTTQTMTASNLNGTYVFLLNGPKPDFFVGSFTADGGANITGQLVAVSGSDIIPMPDPFTGTYSVFPDGRGDMTIVLPPLFLQRTCALRWELTATKEE
jgi:Big-like domain-containing protein